MKRLLGTALLAFSFAAAASATVTGTVVDDDGAPLAGVTVRAFAAETPQATAARILAGKLEREPIARVETAADGAFRLDVGSTPLVTLAIAAPGRVLLQLDATDGDDTGPLMLTAMKSHKLKITGGGKPLANAILVAGSVWAAKTGEDGTLDIPQITGPVLNIAILHPDYAALTPGFIPQTPEISLSRGGSIRGRVVAEDGKTPVAHARVSIGDWTTTETADDGSFTIAHTPARWTMLRVSAPAGVAFMPQTSTASYTIRLHPAASLSGTVRDAKGRGAVAGMRLSLLMRSDVTTSESVITDAKGAFAFDAIPAGPYTMSGTSSNYLLDFRTPLELKAGERESRALTATPFARVQGSVVDEEKKPIRGAVVTRGFGMRLEGVARVAVTNARGEFALRAPALAAADNELQASKDGYAGATAKAKFAAGETTTGVTITLTRGIPLGIKVIDTDKRPVAGARIAIAQWRNEPFSGRAPVMRCSGDNACVTGDDGSLTLRVAPGKCDISVVGDRIVTKSVNAQNIDEKTSPLTIVVERGSEVSGRVVAADGTGVVDAHVTLQSAGAAPLAATTDASGAFAFFTAPRGPVTLQAALSRGSRLVSGKKEVEAPQTNVVLTMPRGGSISGRVVDDSTRAPITEFQVMAMHAGAVTPVTPVQSDAGAFTIGDLMPGSTDVQIAARGYAPATVRGVEVEEGKTTTDVEVRMSRGATVKGRVTSSDGQPVEGVSVFVDSSPGRRLIGVMDRDSTDSNGNYSIDGVVPGSRRVTFTKTGYAEAQKSIDATAGREVTLDVTLDRGRELRGKVIDESGQPVAQADIRVETEMVPPARTEVDGTFVIGGLRDTKYRVVARKSGYLEARADDADPNGAPLTLTLRRGGTITGHVTAGSDIDLSYAVVNVVGPGGATNGRVEPSGSFTVTGVPDGRFMVDASIPGTPQRRSGRKTVDVINGTAPSVELSFSEGITIRGRVTQNGRPLPGVSVGFTPTDPSAGGGTFARAESDGNYVAGGLTAGEYNVFVSAPESGGVFNERVNFANSGVYDIDVRAWALRGHVIDAQSGQPIADAQISFQQVGNLAGGGMGVRPTTSDFSGRFVSDLVPEKKWRLRVQREKYETTFVDVDVVQGMPEIEVKLAPAIATMVRVVESRNGAPVGNAYVTASDSTGRPLASATTAEDGTAKLWLGPGRYTIHATGINYIGASATTDVPGPNVQLSLDRAGRIVIASPAGARVRLSGGPLTNAILSFNGRFDVVRPGTYVIELLSRDNNSLQRKNIVVVEGQTTTVTF